MFQGQQEGIEALQPALSHPLHPGPNLAFRYRLRRRMLKDGRQLLTQVVGSFQLWSVLEQLSQALGVLRVSIHWVSYGKPTCCLSAGDIRQAGKLFFSAGVLVGAVCPPPGDNGRLRESDPPQSEPFSTLGCSV